MDINRYKESAYIRLGMILLVIASVIGCASTDQQSDAYDDYYDNYGDDDYSYGEGGEYVNNAGNEYDDYGYGEDVNNYSYNEFDDSNLAWDDGGYGEYENELALGNDSNFLSNYGNMTADTYGEYTNNAEESADPFLTANMGLNLMNESANAIVEPDLAPVNAAMDTPMMDAPVNAAAPMALSGGVVKYIKETTTIYDAPNGQSIGSAWIGDHPVVWDEGNYHRDSRGRYIPSSALTNSGVGRPRDRGAWRSSGGGY